MRPAAFVILSLLTVGSLICGGCGPRSRHGREDASACALPETLRVATLYSPMSYFIYRGEVMGYDYGLVSKFAQDKGLTIDLKVASSMASMIAMLDSGEVDLLAYEVPITAEYKGHVRPCGVANYTSQVLVQPKKGDGGRITDVTQLVGKDIYVEKNSKYQYRLENLNNELGGGINILAVDKDTLITEDLIEMVSSGAIPLTVVDSDIARLNKSYYKDLDISLELSFPQGACWGVSPAMPWLADSINAWFDQESPKRTQAELLKRYFELSRSGASGYALNFSKGKVSPYDALFKKYAERIGWDWRLLAAQGYAESNFDSTVVSWAGARGIMQIMPGTAKIYGLSPGEMADPDKNIMTATLILKELDRMLAKYVPDPFERIKFIIGAYNSGIAHVYDAIALAEKHGKNPRLWDGNVADAILMKANPEYYNDPVCKYGYFRGRQTIEYVNRVMSIYALIRQNIRR